MTAQLERADPGFCLANQRESQEPGKDGQLGGFDARPIRPAGFLKGCRTLGFAAMEAQELPQREPRLERDAAVFHGRRKSQQEGQISSPQGSKEHRCSQ